MARQECWFSGGDRHLQCSREKMSHLELVCVAHTLTHAHQLRHDIFTWVPGGQFLPSPHFSGKWVRHEVLQACGAQQPPNCLQREAWAQEVQPAAPRPRPVPCGWQVTSQGEAAFSLPPRASSVSVACCAWSRGPDGQCDPEATQESRRPGVVGRGATLPSSLKTGAVYR